MAIYQIHYRKDNFVGREVGLELVVPKFGTASASLAELIRKTHFERYIFLQITSLKYLIHSCN